MKHVGDLSGQRGWISEVNVPELASQPRVEGCDFDVAWSEEDECYIARVIDDKYGWVVADGQTIPWALHALAGALDLAAYSYEKDHYDAQIAHWKAQACRCIRMPDSGTYTGQPPRCPIDGHHGFRS